MTTRCRLPFLALFAAAALLARTDPAFACGHCQGDKVASVYDFMIINAAQKAGHLVEFAEVNGAFRMSGEDNAALGQELAKFPGVDKDSVRVSANPNAVSFAFNPLDGSPEAMLIRINKKLAARKWALVHLQTINPPKK